MANFTPIFKTVLGWEGGYQNMPSDKGNYTSSGRLVGTNRGVSAKAYETYIGREPSIAEMKAITPKIAENVYKKLFWDKLRGDEIRNQDLAHIIFDITMNSGSPINKILRTALAETGKSNVVVNYPNKFPDDTIKAINRSNSKKLFYAIKEQRRKHLESLRFKYPEFIKGWLRRLNSFEFNKNKRLIGIGIASIVLSIGGYYAYTRFKK